MPRQSSSGQCRGETKLVIATVPANCCGGRGVQLIGPFAGDVGGTLELAHFAPDRQLGTNRLTDDEATARGNEGNFQAAASLVAFDRIGRALTPQRFQTVALAGDLHDAGVVQDAIEHGSGKYGVAGKRPAPGAEGQGWK
jgi:hypothetical protein